MRGSSSKARLSGPTSLGLAAGSRLSPFLGKCQNLGLLSWAVARYCPPGLLPVLLAGAGHTHLYVQQEASLPTVPQGLQSPE